MTRILCITVVMVLVFIHCAEDIQSPTVDIVQPVDGDTVSGNVEILVEANDDVGVEKVEIYINDALREELFIEPYRYTWNTLALPDNSSQRLQARAYDAADNEGVSSIVTVTVYNGTSLYTLEHGVIR